MEKTLSHTVVILVCDLIDISGLNSILMLGDCVGTGGRIGKNWHWRSYVGVGLANKLSSPVSPAKYSCGVFLRKNDNLGELGHRGFLAYLVVYLICFIFVTAREAVFGEDYVIEFCGGTCSEQ